MATEPVRSTAVVAAPKDYSIPGAQVIRLLSARASFTDNGAAGDWLPALQVLDNNGNVLVTAADQGVKVTAGSDADVSWFPGVKPQAAASTAGGLVFAQAVLDQGKGDMPQTVNGGSTANGGYPNASTTDATVIEWSTVINTNDTALLHALGTYMLTVSARWAVGGTSLSTEIFSSSAQPRPPHLPDVPNTSPTILDFDNTVWDWTIIHNTHGTPQIKTLHNNQTGGPINVNVSYFTIVYFPTG